MPEQEKYNLEYVPHKRFVVEIIDQRSGKTYYSKRTCLKKSADQIKEHYHNIAGFVAQILDTKIGENV